MDRLLSRFSVVLSYIVGCIHFVSCQFGCTNDNTVEINTLVLKRDKCLAASCISRKGNFRCFQSLVEFRVLKFKINIFNSVLVRLQQTILLCLVLMVHLLA